MEQLAKYLKALVLMQLADSQAAAAREGRTLKLELLLADAGFGNNEVAQLLNKSPTATAKAISRARAARRSPVDVSDTQPESLSEEERQGH